MTDTLVTHLQLFGIGVAFTVAGPCLVSCMPPLLACAGAVSGPWRTRMGAVLLFLAGRCIAYLLLGAAAGLSGGVVRSLGGAGYDAPLRYLAGLVGICLGIIVLLRLRRDGGGTGCRERRAASPGAVQSGGFFLFGLTLGSLPCVPLGALLLEIALMASSPLEGALYAFSFGAGTFVTGALLAGAALGLVAWMPASIFRSPLARRIGAVLCASFLIVFGIAMAAGRTYAPGAVP